MAGEIEASRAVELRGEASLPQRERSHWDHDAHAVHSRPPAVHVECERM
jgi:hypothetical protein